MRIAIIHDWLLTMRGGEHCLDILLEKYPEADVYTAFYDSDAVSERIAAASVFASPFSKLPGIKKYYRFLLPLYPIVAFFLSRRMEKEHAREKYDIVVSISHCLAKNVSVPKGVPHLCYCLSPVRYLWDQYERYFSAKAYEPIVRLCLSPLRAWDRRGARRITHFVGISEFIRKRIRSCYARESSLVYPPVDTSWISAAEGAAGSDAPFVCANALVPYKNTHLVVEAFKELPYDLQVVGEGPELSRLKAIAADNVTFRGFVSRTELADIFKESRALVFAAEEDFGITPVEVQSAGRPVIAFASGGSLETVSPKVGTFFSELTVSSIVEAVNEFSARRDTVAIETCREHAQKFSPAHYLSGIEAAVNELVDLGKSNADCSFDEASGGVRANA